MPINKFLDSYIQWCESGASRENSSALTFDERNFLDGNNIDINALLTSLREKLGFHLPYYLEAKHKQLGLTSSSICNTPQPKINQEMAIEQLQTDSPEVATEGNITEADASWAAEKTKGSGFTDISKMSYKDLISKETKGQISPGLKRFFTTGIKIPLPTGYRIDQPDKKLLGKNAEMIPFVEDEEKFEPEKNDIQISYPLSTKTPKSLAMPIGYDIVACDDEDGYSVTKPSKNLPLVFHNVDIIENRTAEFTIRQSLEKNTFSIENFRPSAAESAYWRKVLPLSAEVQEYCRQNPRDIFNAIASYVKENYRYVCHDEVGQFILKNNTDLALIMDELRVGHCDILSWVEAAYLRGLGITAFVTSDMCTNDDGTAFMARYGHARVCIIDQAGKLIFHDPAAACPQAPEYTPDVFPGALLEKLEISYAKANNEAEKRDCIRVFRARLADFVRKNSQNFSGNSGQFGFHGLGEGISKMINFGPTPERRAVNNSAYDSFSLAGMEPITANKEFHELLNNVSFETRAEWKLDHLINNNFPRGTRQKSARIINTLDSPINDVYISRWFLDELTGTDSDNKVLSILQDSLYNPEGDALEFFKILNHISNIEEFRQHLMVDFFNYIPKYAFNIDGHESSGIYSDYQCLKNLIVNPRYEFQAEFKSILIPNLGKKAFIDLCELFDDSDFKNLVELIFFFRLWTKAFQDQQIFNRLQEEFGITEDIMHQWADSIQSTKRSNGRPERKVLPLLSMSDKARKAKEEFSNLSPEMQNEITKLEKKYPKNHEEDAEEYAKMKELHSPRSLREIFRVSNKSIVLLRRKISNLLKLIDRSPRKKLAEPRYEDIRLDIYSPDIHDAKDINWLISARVGEVIAKTPAPVKPKAQPLHIYLDLEYSQNHWGDDFIELHYFASQQFFLEVLIQELNKEAKANDRDIYIATSHNSCYLKLNLPKQNPAILANQLLIDESGKDLSLSTKSGLPKNLIYLSHSEGKIAATKYQAKKINLVADTYKNFGLIIKPLVKEEWIDAGPDSVETEG